jgi:peptide chain release factor 1
MDIRTTMKRIEGDFLELERRLADPAVLRDPDRLRSVGRQRAQLEDTVHLYRDYEKALADAADAEAMLADAEDDEMRDFLQAEFERNSARATELHDALLLHLVPRDPMEDRNAIVEIRAGTGGEEAALFAGDLLTMYLGLAERRGWKVHILEDNPSELKGYKEVTLQIEGAAAYGALHLESGIHRVQRVPQTESQGRIHTSAASVAVLPEVEDVDVEINASDLRIEAFRAGGPGGQHMQKNETAVRVTHIPSGISSACSDGRSQHQNREKALRVLRSRIYDVLRQQQEAELAKTRRGLVGSGDRSEKIRTYNYPQDRITDHRIGMTVHDLASRMTGEIDDLIEALRQWERQQRLQHVLGAAEK